MWSRTLPVLLSAAVSGVQALKNASPVIMFSTEPFEHHAIFSQEIASASAIEAGLTRAIAKCDDFLYLLLSQPGLTTEDVRDASAMPKLSERVAESDAVVEIPTMIGQLNMKEIAKNGVKECQDSTLRLGWIGEQVSKGTDVDVPRLSDGLVKASTPEERRKVLKETDDFIASTLEKLERPYILVFTGGSGPALATQHEDLPYEMDDPYPSGLHTDLKRDMEHHRREDKGGNANSDLPLFEKYQFLTPGLFMGLSVTVLLGLIIYVGVTAIAGLEVSYAAFSKEMGPQAQNKGKQ